MEPFFIQIITWAKCYSEEKKSCFCMLNCISVWLTKGNTFGWGGCVFQCKCSREAIICPLRFQEMKGKRDFLVYKSPYGILFATLKGHALFSATQRRTSGIPLPIDLYDMHSKISVPQIMKIYDWKHAFLFFLCLSGLMLDVFWCAICPHTAGHN